MGKLYLKIVTFVFTAGICANVFPQSSNGSIKIEGVARVYIDNSFVCGTIIDVCADTLFIDRFYSDNNGYYSFKVPKYDSISLSIGGEIGNCSGLDTVVYSDVRLDNVRLEYYPEMVIHYGDGVRIERPQRTIPLDYFGQKFDKDSPAFRRGH